MAKEITFPYQLKFHYSIYDFDGIYKVKGERLSEVVLKDGKRLSLNKPKGQLECGVELDFSERQKYSDTFENTTTVTITDLINPKL